MSLRRRLAISVAIAFTVLLLGVSRQTTVHAGDFTLPLCAAENLLNGIDPYSCNTFVNGRFWPSNPLTTACLALGFLPFGRFAAQFLFAAISFALAFAVLQGGEHWRLLVFLSAPFFEAFQLLQWSPLLLAVAFLPGLFPLLLVKPQIGLPVMITRFTHRRALATIAFFLVTLALEPWWIARWWTQSAATYSGYVPLALLPLGPLVLLALLGWRERDSRFLLCMAATPQRGFYDALLLWCLPQTRFQMILMNVSSWVGFLMASFVPIDPAHYEWRAIAFLYLPALGVVLAPRLRGMAPHVLHSRPA